MTTAAAPVVAAFQDLISLAGLSIINANGARSTVDMTESTAKRLAAPMFSPLGLFMDNFEKILRAVNAKLEVIADKKPSQVNETSETEAMITPATTGNKEAYTGNGKIDCKKMPEPTTLTKGSIDLTTCVKETATAPKETTVET